MKLALIYILIIPVLSHGQILIQSERDIHKIAEQKELFISKPLKILLQEIKPPIKRVIATPSNNIYQYVGNFRFNFMDNNMVNSTRAKGQTPITLVVFVKEYFDWNYDKRPKGKETVWTSEDAKKFANLTVVGFRIYGDVTSPN